MICLINTIIGVVTKTGAWENNGVSLLRIVFACLALECWKFDYYCCQVLVLEAP